MASINRPRSTSPSSGRRYTLTERVAKFKDLNKDASAMDQLNFYREISSEYTPTNTANPPSSSSSSTALTNIPRGEMIPDVPRFVLPQHRPTLPIMEAGQAGELTRYTGQPMDHSQAMTPFNPEQSLSQTFKAPTPHTQADILRAFNTHDAENVQAYANEERSFVYYVNGQQPLDDNQKMNLRRLKPEFLPRLGEDSEIGQYARNSVLNGFMINTPAEQNFYNQTTRNLPFPPNLFGNV